MFPQLLPVIFAVVFTIASACAVVTLVSWMAEGPSDAANNKE